MEEKDLIIAIFGAAVGLAGILLVFVGFIYAHSETPDLEALRTKYKTVAKVGLVPFLASLVCAFFCLRWMLCASTPSLFCGYEGWLTASICSFYLSLGLTALYGIAGFLLYL